MKRLALLSLALVCALSLPSCIKVTGSSDIKADASGTVSFTFALNTEALETIKGFMDAAGEMGGEEMEKAQEAFDKIDEFFDDKKMAEDLKKQGLEVVSAKSGEKDGWKTMEVQAKFKDVNAWIAKAEKESKKEMDDLPIDLPIGDMSLVPSFYKTDTQGVGEVVLIPSLTDMFADSPIDLEELEEMSDEELDMIEGQIDMMKSMLALDQMKMGFELKLPGKILSTKGCKKSGDNGIKFNIGGGDLNIDGIRNLFGMKNGISATFAVPQGCKIQFKDKKAKKDDKDGGEEKKGDQEKKKGGLKIGEGKGKKG